MTSLLIANLVAYSAQVACIVGVGSLLPRLLRIHAPAVRYAYWRALLAFCLVLPLLQGRQTAAPSSGAVTSSVSDVRVAAVAGAGWPGVDWLQIAVLVLIGGAALRIVWTVMSLMHLHRLRSAGRQAAPCALRDELQRALGTKAEIRYVSGLGQPVTFGVRWPVVLLPDDTLTQPAEIQHAVLCHELIHVDRRDWAWVLAEEIVRAALWFHPAVWWTVSRIQAAREEVVDQQAVRITGARRRYIEALMAFADAAPVAPAAAFSRRQHLFRRILLLSKDRDVSPARLTASCFAMLLVLLAGSWRAIDAFPLLEAASGIAPAITSPEPASNHAATTASIEPRGAVSGVIGGPTPSLPSVAPPPAPVPAPTRPQRSPSASNPGTTAQPRAEGEESVGPPVESGRVEEHDLLVLPESRDTSSHAPAGGVIGGIVGGVVGGVVPPPPPPPPPPPQASALRVGGRIQAPRKIKDVKPAYPPIAEAARVQGIVILEATIGADGRVTDARVIRSIPLLDAAALDAVRQWEFTPTLLNGDPTPIVMTVTVNFTLN